MAVGPSTRERTRRIRWDMDEVIRLYGFCLAVCIALAMTSMPARSCSCSKSHGMYKGPHRG